MEENRKHIDDIYREKLGDYTEVPDAAVWQSLSSKLQVQPASGVSGASGVKLVVLWKLLAVLATLGLLFWGAMHIWNKTDKPVKNNSSSSTDTYYSTNITNTVTSVGKTDGEDANENKTAVTDLKPADTIASIAHTAGKNNTVSQENNPVSHDTVASGKKQSVSNSNAISTTNTKPSSLSSPINKNNSITPQTVANKNTGTSTVNKTANADSVTGTKPQSYTTNNIFTNKNNKKITPAKTISPLSANNNKPTNSNSPISNSKKLAQNGTKPFPIGKTSPQKNTANNGMIAASRSSAQSPVAKTSKVSQQKNSSRQKKQANQTFAQQQLNTGTPATNSGSNNMVNMSAGTIPPPSAAKKNHTVDSDNINIAVDTNIANTTSPIATTDTSSKPQQTNPTIAETEKERKRQKLQFGYGAKAGYEIGFGDYKVNSLVISPYIQLKISKKFSVLVQPTIKNSSINKTELDATGKPYYNIKNSKIDSLHSTVQTGADSFGQPIYGIKRKYIYSQTHDSIVAGNTSISAKTYYEFELPVLVQYEIIKHVHIYAGVSANFSKIVTIKEEQSRYENITRYDTLTYAVAPTGSPAPVIPSASSRFSYSYSPYSQYTSAAQNSVSNPVRFSYMLGFNYEVWRRLSIDVLLQGLLSSPSYIPDTRIRGIYSSPHIRFGIGYRLNK